jgi:hypothetical protein
MADFFIRLGERYNNRVAFVATDDLTFGLARMGSVASERRGVESSVFRAFEDARRLLLSEDPRSI